MSGFADVLGASVFLAGVLVLPLAVLGFAFGGWWRQ